MLVDLLNKQSGVSTSRLNRLAETASKRYKVYKIPKRNGGFRTIEHPSREIKAIQRWISNFILKKFPIHECATAYKKGSSIKKNAELHKHTRFTIRIDFKNFFPSFTSAAIKSFLEDQKDFSSNLLTDDDVEFICAIVCRNGKLTIGAPTSPIISNIMMFDFDRATYEYASENNLIYTRYADDIFISSSCSNSLNNIQEKINEIIKKIHYLNLDINPDKTVHLSRRYKRSISGLIITPDFKVSIGRDRKREIKTLVFKYKNQQLTKEKIEYLRGLLSFAADAEPDFVNRLSDKYDSDIVSSILKSKSIKKK